ncbi:HORMA-1 domain-containing protein [Mycolicibacterium stellerae]|uniref:HORMA-1 domain-containing protein n=1 Tax=Mycolicibacterium stellerae TaxID=2358193 RepID=UPI0013DDA48C|nr:hypothetical protein [Mycolicibacterium stellerae]
MTQSNTVTQTFTRTHAKYLASKVIGDLYQCHTYYERPTEADIVEYQEELVVMLANGYVSEYEFGFERSDRRIVSWQYRVDARGELVGGSDDLSGGIYARASVANASFFNFMSYSWKWSLLTRPEQNAVKAEHHVQRTDGELPMDGNGYWQTDRTYTSGGVALERRTFRPL